jgi:hypothetical protein
MGMETMKRMIIELLHIKSPALRAEIKALHNIQCNVRFGTSWKCR